MKTEIQNLVDNFTSLSNEMKATLARQNDEIRTNGESTEATGRRVDEIGNLLTQIQTDIRAEQNRLDEIEKRANRIGGGGADAQTVGARFAASDQIKTLRNGSGNTSEEFMVGAFLPRNALTGASSGGVVVPDRRLDIIGGAERQLRMRDLLNVTPTTGSSIEYVRETGFTNAGAPVAEGGSKPESDLTYTKLTAPVEVIAHWVQITRQLLSDAPRLEATVEGRLRYGLYVKEEAQILYGTGSTPQLKGIMTDPAVGTYAWSDGQVGDTKLDAIRRAMLVARLAEYPVTGTVLHPTDWADIELLKGSDGHYLWISVPEGGVMRLWRVPVVETTAINAGDFLTGAFGLGATLFDREETTLRVTDSHSDYFIKNKLVMLVEERVALTVERPEAFVAGDFDSAPVEAP